MDFSQKYLNKILNTLLLKSLATPSSVWSKTTLITGGVGKAGHSVRWTWTPEKIKIEN